MTAVETHKRQRQCLTGPATAHRRHSRRRRRGHRQRRWLRLIRPPPEEIRASALEDSPCLRHGLRLTAAVFCTKFGCWPRDLGSPSAAAAAVARSACIEPLLKTKDGKVDEQRCFNRALITAAARSASAAVKSCVDSKSKSASSSSISAAAFALLTLPCCSDPCRIASRCAFLEKTAVEAQEKGRGRARERP